MSTKGTGRPLKSAHDRLSERLVTKVTPREAEAFRRRVADVCAAGPQVTEAAYLRWLVQQDLAAHGLLGATSSEQPPPT